MNTRPSALIVENSHVLLLRYRYADQDVFALPGGNPDPGESLISALLRELDEELGIEVEISSTVLFGEVLQAPRRPDVLHCVFEVQIIAGLPTLNVAHTSASEVVWKPISMLPSLNLYPNVGNHILLKRGGYVGPIQQTFFE